MALTHELLPAQDADADLVAAAQQGDRDAFDGLVNRHYRTSLKLARSILHDEPDAEDEVQNAFTKVFLNLSRFEGHSRFATWLNRIVVNQCLMRIRGKKRAALTYLDEPISEETTHAHELRDQTLNPEQTLAKDETAALVQRELRRIPALLREPLLLRESKGMGLAEVARELNISESAAKSRLLRARRELKERLARHLTVSASHPTFA
jgi:RNA polymerase sigma-70 factor (ECF subfamily)